MSARKTRDGAKLAIAGLTPLDSREQARVNGGRRRPPLEVIDAPRRPDPIAAMRAIGGNVIS